MSGAMCLLVLAQFQFVPASAEGAQVQSLQLMNKSSFVDESKILHVYADIQNNLQVSRKNIVVTANFFDRSGARIGSSNTSSALSQLDPGDVSPVEIQLLSTGNASRVANYSLTVSSDPAQSPLANRLRVLSADSRLDLLGTFYVNLVAQNQANVTATDALAVATLYDKDGNVIAIGKALAESVPGSADIPANTTGAFGIAVTEKSQTYKAVRYSVVLQSDQFKSSPVDLDAKSGSYSVTTAPGKTVSRCLIATAAFGSDFAPQVQTLREFRDDIALRTFAGSNFMLVFNQWYYSFSPAVADYERSAPWMQQSVRIAIQPLLFALEISRGIDISVQGYASPELAIIVSGLAASLLIGALYLAPVAGSIALATRCRPGPRSGFVIRTVLIASCSGAAAILFGVLFSNPFLAMLGSSVLVISALSASPLAAYRYVRLKT